MNNKVSKQSKVKTRGNVLTVNKITGFTEVNSLKNLKSGVMYTTYNYGLFKHLENNRGEDYSKGMNKRIAEMIKKVEEGVFLWRIQHGLINKLWKLIDGHSRYFALKWLYEHAIDEDKEKYPFNFMLTDEPAFNCKNDSDTLNNVSDVATNSAWKPTDAYVSALNSGEVVAVHIDKLKEDLVNSLPSDATAKDVEEMIYIKKLLTPSRIVAIAKKNGKGLAGKGLVRREYCSKDNLKLLKSSDFIRDIKFVVNVLKIVRKDNDAVTPFFVIRCLMPSIWINKDNLDVKLRHVKRIGFNNMKGSLMTHVESRVDKIINFREVAK